MKKQTVNIVVYIASPLGFYEAGRYFYYTKLVPLITELGFEIRDPWALTPIELTNSAKNLPDGQKRKEAWKKVNCIIGENNIQAIEESDIIVAVLDGTNVDDGTSGEIGWSSARGKLIIGYREDFRLSSDNDGCMVNLQIERFIYRNGGEIVTSLEALKVALVKHKEAILPSKK